MIIIKRDGRTEQWNEEKLLIALNKTLHSCHKNFENQELNQIITNIKKYVFSNFLESIHINELHKIVEFSLMDFDKDLAREYISYRSMRDKERLKHSNLLKEINGLIQQTDEDLLNQNANKSSRILSTHRDLLAGILSKEFSKFDMRDTVFVAQEQGIIYQHDRDYALTYGLHNCGVYNYADMLKNGFVLGNAKIATPNSVGVATTILSQIASTIGGSSYGGQSIHRYAELLLPYVEKSKHKLLIEQKEYHLPDEWVEKKLRKEVYDAHQTFIYQTNTICGTNGQSAFLTISLYPSENPLVQMITEEYLKCHMAGIGDDHRTPVFPKVIYFVEKGVNLEEKDPLHHQLLLALECSSKRMYPDYVMVENNKKMTGFNDVVTPMGCRSFVPFYQENNQDKYVGRFNLGVVTVNVPFAAAKAKGNKEEFFKLLNEYCELCFLSHMDRINRFKSTLAKSNPIMWVEGALARLNPDDTIEPLIYNGNATASLGYIGIYEAQELCHDTSKEFAIEILQFLKNKTSQWYEKTNIAFSLYGTPAESLCYHFATKLKKEFPEFHFENDYITNSFHLPVKINVDVFDKLNYESDFYLLSSGGNVNNIEIPNLKDNIAAFESLIRYAYDKVNYLIVNQPVDQCFKCGFEGEFDCTENGFTCPSCGNHDDQSISVIRRVSGYISAPNSRPFNKGKQQEVLNRIKHFKE